MIIYPSDIISTGNGGLLALCHVESIRMASEEDRLEDALKGDVSVIMTTVSGQEHRISMSKIKEIDNRFKDADCHQLMIAIADRWKHILTRVQ